MRKVVPLKFERGMWASGDPGLIPDGYARLLTNSLLRPGPRLIKRQAALAEAASVTTGFVGYANWEDSTNLVSRVVAFYTNGAATDFRVKDTGAETYGSAVTGTTGTGAPATFTNYRGQLYFTMASGTPTATPDGLFSYNGSTVATNPLGGETLYALAIATFIDRLVLGYVRASVINRLGTSVAYDSQGWAATSVTRENITNGTTVTSRITPTDDETADIRNDNTHTVAASTSDTSLVLRADLRNTSPVDEMPMTLEIYYSQAWAAATGYTGGAIRVPTTLNGFRYRATNTGTSGATEPGWPTTKSETVLDNDITWICDGDEEVASQPITLPTITEVPGFLPWWCTATIPPNPVSASIGVRIKFGTVAQPTFKLNAIDISLKDGLADGTLTKRNYGQQLTTGKFFYPFFNQESSATATVDLDNDIYWTETSDPNTIVGDNFQRLSDLPGRVTAMAVVGGRLVVFKKRGMWVFQGSTDFQKPLIRERFFENTGCLGPRAVTVFEDTLYFIGDNEVYAFRPGEEPEPLCGDGMRETVRPSGGGIELSDNVLATVAVDAGNRDLWVGALEAGAYVMNLDKKAWTHIDIDSSADPGNGLPITRLLWNTSRQVLYASATSTLTGRPFRWGAGAADTVSGASATCTQTTRFRPLESTHDRERYVLQEVGVWGRSTASQTFTVVASLQTISSDANSIASKTNAVTLPVNNQSAVFATPRTVIPIRQMGANVQVSLTHAAATNAMTLYRAEAILKMLGRERPGSTPTQGAASL